MADYKRFPGLTGATAYPGTATVNPYRYENTFDYSRWQADTTLTMANVPWCGDYDNTVKFADDIARDAYLAGVAGPSYTLDTMRHIKPDGTIKLPWPVSVVQLFNYLIVDLPRPTSDDAPIWGASGDRVGRFLYFIDDAVESAASTTTCAVRLDVWQTFINRMSFPYVMLERGHAPMSAVSVDDYLEDPLGTNRYLLAPDVDLGREPSVARSTTAKVLNAGDQWAVIVSYADAGGAWGSIAGTSATTPAASHTATEGAPAPVAYAVDVADLAGLLADIDAQVPQFKATVLGCFFVAKSMVTVARTVSLAGHALSVLTAARQVSALSSLDKADFGYPAPYSEIAKLYTSPYAYLVVSDHEGASQRVRIEDTVGAVSVSTCVNLVYPWVSVDSHLLGIGGASADLTFQVEEARSFTYGGSFAETFRRWGVPVFAVAQSGADDATWSHLYDRAQAQLAASNAQASALASNATAKTNADNSAANVTANNAVAVAANTALTATANATASELAQSANALASAATSWDNDSCTAAYEAELAGLAVAATNNQIAAGQGAVNTLVSTAANAATGNVIGTVVAAVSGLMNTATSAEMANNSNTVSQSNADTIYNQTIAANTAKMNNSNSATTRNTNAQNDQRSSNNTTQNNASTSTAQNNASLISTNAANTKATGDANAGRAYQTATSEIANARAQQGLRPPIAHGSPSSGETAVTRPLALFAQVMTQTDAAIAGAGDAFLRYGYALNQQWKMDDMQVMPHFTYWKCSEIWCAGPGNAIEGAQQHIKEIFERGVTVWSDPDEIGQVSIYDNI